MIPLQQRWQTKRDPNGTRPKTKAKRGRTKQNSRNRKYAKRVKWKNQRHFLRMSNIGGQTPPGKIARGGPKFANRKIGNVFTL